MPAPGALLAQRARFKAFLAARLGSEAEDVLQESLLKAWPACPRCVIPTG